MSISIKELTSSRDTVNRWMERYGVRFGVYKNGVFNEQLFPFDSVPRVISHSDWEYLEKGLSQRVKALNMFLWDTQHVPMGHISREEHYQGRYRTRGVCLFVKRLYA